MLHDDVVLEIFDFFAYADEDHDSLEDIDAYITPNVDNLVDLLERCSDSVCRIELERG
jgi:hypothetical protein